MSVSEFIDKVWSHTSALRDDGVSYGICATFGGNRGALKCKVKIKSMNHGEHGAHGVVKVKSKDKKIKGVHGEKRKSKAKIKSEKLLPRGTRGRAIWGKTKPPSQEH